MLRHNKSIALETLDEVAVIEKYLTNHIKGDVRKIDIISDIVEMIKKLIDMNLIIVED